MAEQGEIYTVVLEQKSGGAQRRDGERQDSDGAKPAHESRVARGVERPELPAQKSEIGGFSRALPRLSTSHRIRSAGLLKPAFFMTTRSLARTDLFVASKTPSREAIETASGLDQGIIRT